MKEKKLSKDELIEIVNETFAFTIGLVTIQKRKEKLDQACRQIKESLIESSKEPSEAEVTEFLTNKMYELNGLIQRETKVTPYFVNVEHFINSFRKEYDQLRKRRG